MCDCLEEKRLKLIEHKDKIPELTGKEIKDAYFLNTGWLLDSKGLQLFVPFRYEYENVARSGRVTVKKKEISMTIGYCPFCGEKVEKGSGRHDEDS